MSCDFGIWHPRAEVNPKYALCELQTLFLPPPSPLSLAPTPAALDAVPDFKTPAVWGEITEKPPVGLGTKERREATQPMGRY